MDRCPDAAQWPSLQMGKGKKLTNSRNRTFWKSSSIAAEQQELGQLKKVWSMNLMAQVDSW